MILLEMSASGSILILATAIVRALAIHRLPKVTFVVLWGIIICRLLVPFSITSPFRMDAVIHPGNIFLPEQVSSSAAALPQATAIMPATTAPATANPVDLVLILWGIGFMACAAYFLITHIRFLREFETALPIDQPIIVEWLRSHKTIRHVRIRQFDRISAPLTYGVFRPVILMPKVIDWTDEKQIQYMLAHELTHIKRFDTAWKWLLAISLWVHWFNPLIWVMYMLANRDLELSCDEAVVRRFGETQRGAYARTLINLEERRSPDSLLYNNFSKDSIKERIQAIMKLKKTTLAGITAAVLLVLMAVVLFATSGPMRIRLSRPGNGTTISAVPSSPGGPATVAGVTKLANGSLSALPISENPLSASYLAGLAADAKNISDAKDLIQSISPADQAIASPFSRIVIGFKQDMDASTLDYPNIIILQDQHTTALNYVFNFNYDEKTHMLYLDMKPDFIQNGRGGVGTGNTIHVFLTNKIKTADGKFIEADYVFSYHTY